MDLSWVGAFINAHGYPPSQQDWEDYQLSVRYPGSGPGGGWTTGDWQAYAQERNILGSELLSEIGQPGESLGTVLNEGLVASLLVNPKTTPSVAGPNGTRIFLGGVVPGPAAAWTFGNWIVLNSQYVQKQGIDPTSVHSFAALNANPALHALIAHEYTHVLEYREQGVWFLPGYVMAGLRAAVLAGGFAAFGQRGNPYEATAYDTQDVYGSVPTLPGPWAFPQ